MKLILYFITGIIVGIFGAIYLYLTISERKEEKFSILLSDKIEELLEKTTMKIGEKQIELKRVLTEEEKNKILDECYLSIK